jgi:hypothetical protein
MEDILERGFQLAYFIFPIRPQAVLILSAAINQLKTQHGRESRRNYWRDKYLKRGITRITREEGDTLQWLIFYESDHHEKEQEASHQATLQDMAVRYIKSLVRLTSAMSSFHVNIGLHRLLHNYSTTETQQMYESITDRFLGADEYRRAKSVLMNKLEERFDGLKTSKSQHGEVRFVSSEQQERWTDLVDLCLKQFTPWSTLNACPVPHNFDGSETKLPPHLSGKGAGEADQNLVEINRCHVFIDPLCFGRLVKALSIEPPSHRLDLPRFFMENSDISNYSDRLPQPPNLSAEERKTITDFATSQADRRQKTTPTTLAIVVDGKECARLEVAGSASRQIEINEGAELLEIWTAHKSEPLLLATHKIAYSSTQGIAPANLSFRFNTAELILQIASNDTAQESARKSAVTLTCRSHARSAEAFPKWLIAAPKFALASIALIALGWFLGLNAHHRTRTKQIAFPGFAEGEKPSLQPLPAPTPSEIAQNSEQPATYRLVPDELATRGNGASDIPSVMVPSHPGLVQLELPIASQNMFKDAAKYAPKSFHCSLKTFLKDETVLSENGLKARRSSSGAIVTFSLPSTFLAENTDYSVDLRSDFHGKSEQLSTYTFHVVKQSK